jgi:hypothetical protein
VALLKVSVGDSASNYGLASANQAIQPEDEVLVVSIRPVVYLLKKVDMGVREAGGFMLSVICIERRFSSSW